MRFSKPTLNPVLRRELVERWRAQRAVWTLTGYLAVLGLLLYVLYRAGSSLLGQQLRFGFSEVDPAVAGPILGRFLVEGLLFFVLVLVLFVAPGYAAAQLSGERERRTLPLLQVTLLRPAQIVLGKLGASVAWISLLVVASLPLGAAAFFLGGVGLGQIVGGLAFILAVGVSVAAFALGISSLTRRTTAAVVLTYAVVLALTGGTMFAAGVEFVIRSSTGQGQQQTPVAMYANPFVGLADVTQTGAGRGMGFGPLPSPLAMIAAALQRTGAGQDGVVEMRARAMPAPLMEEPVEVFLEDFEDFEVVEDGVPTSDPEVPPVELDRAEPMPMPMPPPPDFGPPMPDPFFDEPARRLVWPIVLAVYVALGAAGVIGAALRLRTVPARRRPRPSPSPSPEPTS